MSRSIDEVVADVVAVDEELTIVRLSFDIVLYTSEDFTNIPDAVLSFYRRALALAPPGALKWHATENMSKHKPVTPKVLDMLPQWLRPGAPERPIVHIYLKDGATYADAPGYSIWIWGNEPGEESSHGVDSNVLRCAIPAEAAKDRITELRDLVLELCREVPFDSGHAGYALETTRYRQEASDRAAFRASMRYPGLDIGNPIADSVALAQEAIKGVNWLTIVSHDMLKRIGGLKVIASKLPKEVIVHEVPRGAMFQAGPRPVAGDEATDDLAPYRAVYKAFAELQQPLLERYRSFDLPGGTHREKTRAWLRRLADE
jgi:hypothetical protein